MIQKEWSYESCFIIFGMHEGHGPCGVASPFASWHSWSFCAPTVEALSIVRQIGFVSLWQTTEVRIFDRISAQSARICKTIRGVWAARILSWFIAHIGHRKRWQDEAKERLCKATFLNIAKLPLQIPRPYSRLLQQVIGFQCLACSLTHFGQRTFFVIATHCAMRGWKAAE